MSTIPMKIITIWSTMSLLLEMVRFDNGKLRFGSEMSLLILQTDGKLQLLVLHKNSWLGGV